jgi:HlyD family secretion protein
VTKVSALGIEEQRVPVILDLAGSPGQEALGDGFRVVARITIWEGKNLVAAPIAALFRQGGDWAVYKVVNGRAELSLVQIGRRNPQYAEVTAGLAAGDVVILHPSDQMAPGVAVVPSPQD